MAYGNRRTTTTEILEVFSLNPVPYPVLIILALTLVFLGTSWYLSYEEVIESAEEQINWFLFVVPIALLFIARWVSSVEEDPHSLFYHAMSPWDRRRTTHYLTASEGSSPWGVAAVIVVLIVLVQFRSSFRDSWLI